MVDSHWAENISASRLAKRQVELGFHFVELHVVLAPAFLFYHFSRLELEPQQKISCLPG